MKIMIQNSSGSVVVSGLPELISTDKRKRRKELKSLLKTLATPLTDSSPYPRKEGPVTIIAPGVAVSSDGKGITYDGKIYLLPPDQAPANEAKATRVVGFQRNEDNE